MSVSFDTADSSTSPGNLIKNEAISNSCDKKWSSFLCMLGLSSVISANISSHYPDCGQEKYKLLFNTTIEPRNIYCKGVPNLNILFCFQGHLKSSFALPNLYVPLVFQEIGTKRKNVRPSDVPPKQACRNENKVQSKLSFWTDTLDKEKFISPKTLNKNNVIPSQSICSFFMLFIHLFIYLAIYLCIFIYIFFYFFM